MKEYFVRKSNHIYEDLKRGWSSWNYGELGFKGTKSELEQARRSAFENGESFDISGFELYGDEIKHSDIRELYPNYWVLVDNSRGGGISVNSLTAKNLKDAINELDTHFMDLGTGEWTDSSDLKVVYSNDDLHILERDWDSQFSGGGKIKTMDFFYSYETGPGSFIMKVVDSAGKIIWQSVHPAFVADALTGHLIPDETPMELGIVKSIDDIEGLEKHLKESNLIKQADSLLFAPDKKEEGGKIESNPDWSINDLEESGASYDYDDFQDVLNQIQSPIYKTFNWANEGGDPTIFYYGYDINQAKQELTTQNRDMDYPDRDQTVIVEKLISGLNLDRVSEIKRLYKELSQEMFEEKFPDKKSIADFVNYQPASESEAIDTFDIPAINTDTHELMIDVQRHFGGKYNTIRLPNGKTLNLRIADHSANRGNNTGDRNLSIVISNLNPTERFRKDYSKVHGQELFFDGSSSANEIIEAINEAIEEIKYNEQPNSWANAFDIIPIGDKWVIKDFSTDDFIDKEFDSKEQAEDHAKKEFEKKYGASFESGGTIQECEYFLRYTNNPKKDFKRGTSLHLIDDAESAASIENAKHIKGIGWAVILNGLCAHTIEAKNESDAIEESIELVKWARKHKGTSGNYPEGDGYAAWLFKGKFNGDCEDGILFKPEKIIANISELANNKYVKGGKLTPAKKEKLIKKVTNQYEGKPVPKKYQDKYGKRYSKKEAKSVGYAIANTVEKIKAESKSPLKKKDYNSLLPDF